ncbi:hypothetical protein THRCLA_07096 [Thraustotheca clavata]|uniref:Uncharacterized protein n=1 Tax=Thraustotheca clavata TaxID=74557 RepID=A0A1V9ZGK8_9STRA|nr:hypothetical protein THRCLA_07096 [Thraustotheca clavata]
MVFLRVDFFCHGLDADALTAHVSELKQLSTEFQAGTVCKGDVCIPTDEPSVIFFNSKEEGSIGERIHQLVGTTEEKYGPHAILLDIESRQYYLHKSIDVASIRSMLFQFQESKLEMVQ